MTSDEGEGDDWPDVRRRILDAQILVLGTPIWIGHPSSIAPRTLERLDAILDEKDDDGRMISYDRVALVAVVGNEDGAHNVSAQLFQGLNDLGFTIPANGVTYWVGRAMQSTDYTGPRRHTEGRSPAPPRWRPVMPRTWHGCSPRAPTPSVEPR